MNNKEIVKMASQLQSLANKLLQVVEQDELDYPNHCNELYSALKKKRLYIDEMTKKLGKTTNTVRTEMRHLRNAGINIDKRYVRRTGKYKYFLADAS